MTVHQTAEQLMSRHGRRRKPADSLLFRKTGNSNKALVLLLKSAKIGGKTENNREFHLDADEFGGRAVAAAAGFLKTPCYSPVLRECRRLPSMLPHGRIMPRWPAVTTMST
jgi:hypothetical protein